MATSSPTVDERRKALRATALTITKNNPFRRTSPTVFADFIHVSVLTLRSNMMHLNEAESSYMEFVSSLPDGQDDRRAYLSSLATLLGEVIIDASRNIAGEPRDILGELAMDMNATDSLDSQHFTPYPMAGLLADIAMSGDDAIEKQLAEKGYITVGDPSGCGSGVNLIAGGYHALDLDVTRNQLYLVGVERSELFAKVAWLSLTVNKFPGEIICGNGLQPDDRSWVWRTPFPCDAVDSSAEDSIS